MSSLLLTTTAIELGSIAAKSIYAFWVKDSTLYDISSNVIDFVGSKTSDALAKRKGNRQFEEIGDKITKEILSLFEREGTNLDEGECNAAARTVADTLKHSRISQDLLMQHNLQPALLAQYMLSANLNVTKDLNEMATTLYYRVINEICIYIVDIASQLPSFTEHTFAEVLQREDLISAKVDAVLNDLRKIREDLDPKKEADRFEKEYREAVARNLDVL